MIQGNLCARDVPFATPVKIHPELAKLQPAVLPGFIYGSMFEEFYPKAKIMFILAVFFSEAQSKQPKAVMDWWTYMLSNNVTADSMKRSFGQECMVHLRSELMDQPGCYWEL